MLGSDSKFVSERGEVTRRGEMLDPVAYFIEHVRSADPWVWLIDGSNDEFPRRPPSSVDEAIDFVEALSLIAQDVAEDEEYGDEAAVRRGRRRMRERLDPVLGLLEPPLRLTDDATVVQVLPEDLQRLTDQPVPVGVHASDVDAEVGPPSRSSGAVTPQRSTGTPPVSVSLGYSSV